MFREQDLNYQPGSKIAYRCVYLTKGLTVNNVQGERDCEPSAEDQDVGADVHVIKSLTVNYVQGARDCVPSAQV
jgi:hypothetical protein